MDNDGRRLKFHRLTFNSLPLVLPYLRQSGSRSCDYTVGGIYMWIDYFKYHYCIYRDTLLIKGVAEDDVRRTAFSLPIGAMPLDEAVALLKEHCAYEGLQLEFSAITEERIDDFMALNPTGVYELTQWSDYIYDAAKLATLVGNKMKKKRNHVNKFISSYPDHHIEPLGKDNIDAARAFFDRLCLTKSNNGMAGYERNQTRRVLHDFARYSEAFTGIVLYAGTDIAAFAIGEITGTTLHVHIEKTDHSFAGANEFINMAFVRYCRERSQIDMVNREDDAGDPGLRQAKQSYYPDLLLRKYNITY
ncbi:MAG: DUF2156 domain-containing protein [Muribaculaceae bacterium]